MTLEELRQELLKKDAGSIHSFFAAARDYRNSIPDTSSGPLGKVYAFYCDMVDEAGGIATLADAERFLELGATRLGTSRIIRLVKNEAASGY